VESWRVSSDNKSGAYTHALVAGGGHALFVPIVSSVFRSLRVYASISDGTYWWPIHSEPDVVQFEIAHGVETKRWAYNARNFARVRSLGCAVLGEHGGLRDLFVPVRLAGKAVAVLVVGPFAPRRATGASIQSRWLRLTGEQGHLSDVAFATYVRASLSTLVLDDARTRTLQRLLEDLARLMGGTGKADAIANHADALLRELAEVRLPERMWDAARAMVDERWHKLQFSAASADTLSRMGLMRAANRVLVALTVSQSSKVDPIDEAVRREEFQRACVELACAEGETIVGQVGDHGAVFLLSARGAPRSVSRRMARLADRAAMLARRDFGLSLHAGATPLGQGSLSAQFQNALRAAEVALRQRTRLVNSEQVVLHADALWTSRARLRRIAGEHPELLAAEFDAYVEAVAMHTAHRVEAAMAQLEICFEQLSDILIASSALDPKSLTNIRERLSSSLNDRTLTEVIAEYRKAVGDLADAAQQPVKARQGRGLRAALAHIHENYGQSLGLEKIARLSGFSPAHFSELFKQREGMTFQKYLFRLRMTRTKELLTGTDLNVKRIAELSGYGSPQYLSRVFRRVVGTTPLAYRRKKLPEWFRKKRKVASGTA